MTNATRGFPVSRDPLRLLAEALAPFLRDSALPRHRDVPDGYYSQHDSPLGRRRHLDLARRGLLPRRKVGRLVLVRKADVHAFIELHGAPSPGLRAEDDELADWGLKRRAPR